MHDLLPHAGLATSNRMGAHTPILTEQGLTIDGYLCLAHCKVTDLTRKEPSTSFKKLSAQLAVPPPPQQAAQQQIDFFPAMQASPVNAPKAILQPLLEWRRGSWTISTWLVRGAPGNLDIATGTTAIQVSPGTSLTAVIELKRRVVGHTSYWSYWAGFAGYDAVSLYVDLPYELTEIGFALEAYRVSSRDCKAELPSPPVVFTSIQIEGSDGSPLFPDWNLVQGPSACGFRVTEETRIAKGDTIIFSG